MHKVIFAIVISMVFFGFTNVFADDETRFTPKKMIAKCKTKTESRFKEKLPFLQVKNWNDVKIIKHKSFFDEEVEGTLHFFVIVGNVDVYNKKLGKDANITAMYRFIAGEQDGTSGFNEEVFLYQLQFPEQKNRFEKDKAELIKLIDEGFFVPTARDLLRRISRFRDSLYK